MATDHRDVVAAVEAAGGEAVLTDPAHPSGTDRVAEVSSLPEFKDYPIIANIQGDEPGIRALHLQGPVSMLQDPTWDVTTCAAPLSTEADWRDPSVVKVVRTQAGRALYFSRAPVPHPRDGGFRPGDTKWLHHIGVYVYRKAALERWVSLPPTALENLEKLEQLRALEDGIAIGVAMVDVAPHGVDTEEDLARAEASWGTEPDDVAPDAPSPFTGTEIR